MKAGLADDLKKDLENIIKVSKEYEIVITEAAKKYDGNNAVRRIIEENIEIKQLFDEFHLIYNRINKTI